MMCYVEYFRNSEADLITVHIETLKDPEAVLKQIRDLGAKVGLALNPETDVEAVYPYLHLVDMALVMTVHPGFGGQKYMHDWPQSVKNWVLIMILKWMAVLVRAPLARPWMPVPTFLWQVPVFIVVTHMRMPRN